MKEATASSAAKFTGAEWKNVSRNWFLYVTDVQNTLETATDQEEIRKLHKLSEQGKFVRKTLAPALTHGFQSKQVLDMYSSGLEALLVADPPVDNPFGPYMKSQLHGIRVNNASPASAFWKWMSTTEMKENGFQSGTLQQSQIEFVSGKILTLTQESGNSSKELLASLQDIAKGFFTKYEANMFEDFLTYIDTDTQIELSRLNTNKNKHRNKMPVSYGQKFISCAATQTQASSRWRPVPPTGLPSWRPTWRTPSPRSTSR